MLRMPHLSESLLAVSILLQTEVQFGSLLVGLIFVTHRSGVV
jgi:hypothetical protein